jgi:tetratricopeptide (TPR) repeat protein
VRESRPEVSEGIEAVVQTALRKEPEKRFQTAEEMAGSLDLVSGGFEAMAAAALRKLLGPRYRWLHGKRLAGLVAMALLVLIVGAVLLGDVLRRPAATGAHPTYAVIAADNEGLTDEERQLSRVGARKLYLQLVGWESIKVVDSQQLEGTRMQLVQAGFGLPAGSVTAGLELARKIGASHVIWVLADVRGDSATLVARIHIAGEASPERQLPESGPKNDIDLITAGLALRILEIHGEAAQLPDLLSRSPDHIAHQEYSQGRNALLDWQLAEAEEHFRAAVLQDSAFALAHYQLAMTMYWRTVRDPERILTGEEIQYHVARANQFGDRARLRPGERRDLNAFLSFWVGDYPTARARYDSILGVEPFNLDALLLAGAVELEDPWAATDREGNVVGPRGDINKARAAFDTAVALNPHVQLAWGRLFEIDRKVARAALGGRCRYGFLPPGGLLIPPHEFPEAAETTIYCPLVEDGSIRWRPDSIPAALRDQATAEARQLRDRTVRRLNYWARVEPYQPRPHEELADWMLWERALNGCGADPLWADSLLIEALNHTEQALAFRGDTTPEDLIRLGGLLLATGEASRAADETDRALRALGDWQARDVPPPPKSAANVYLAIGRGHPAVEILEAVDNRSTWSVDDTTEELGSIPGGPVLGTLYALRVLGMTGDDDIGIANRFSTVHRTWARLGYSERQQSLLRSATTAYVSPALLRQPAQQQHWFENWHEYGLETPPVWKGLMAAETRPEEARAYLAEAIEEIDALPPEDRWAIHYYMPIRLADRLGDDAVAADLAARAARCPLRVDTVDFGWGMRRQPAGG